MVWSKGPISVRAYPLGMNWEKVMLLPLEWDAFPLYVNLQNFVRAPAHSAIAGLNYNKTCIEWYCMKLSPCINHLIFIVQNFVSLITVISSSIYQLPLLSSHDQPLLYPSGLFLLFVTCIEQSLKVGLLKWNLEQSSSKIYPYVSRKINVSGVFLSKSLYIKWSLMVQNCIFNLFFFPHYTPYLWKTCLSTHPLFPECDRIRQVQLYWVERWIVRVNLFAKDLDKIIQQGFKWRPLYLKSKSSNHHSSTSPKLASRNSHIHPPQGWTLKLQGSERLLRQLNLLSLSLYLLDPLTSKSD